MNVSMFQITMFCCCFFAFLLFESEFYNKVVFCSDNVKLNRLLSFVFFISINLILEIAFPTIRQFYRCVTRLTILALCQAKTRISLVSVFTVRFNKIWPSATHERTAKKLVILGCSESKAKLLDLSRRGILFIVLYGSLCN